MDLKSLFDEICREFEFPPLEIEESGRYILTINDKFHLHIEKSADQDLLYVYAYMFPALEGYIEPISKKLMELNSFGKLTGPAQISLSPEKKQFILSEAFELHNVTAKSVAHRIKALVKLLHFFEEEWPKWQLELLTSPTRERNRKREEAGKMIFNL